MKLTAVTIAAFSLISTTWAQGQRTGNERKSEPMQTINQTIEMPYYFNLALDNGAKPREISEIITHLAFYSGLGECDVRRWMAKDVFVHRKIGADQLPPALPTLLPLVYCTTLGATLPNCC